MKKGLIGKQGKAPGSLPYGGRRHWDRDSSLAKASKGGKRNSANFPTDLVLKAGIFHRNEKEKRLGSSAPAVFTQY